MILAPDRVIIGDGKTVLENQAVAFSADSGRVLELGTTASLEAKYSEKACFAPGATLLPGLIDLHVHISGWSNIPFGYAGGDFVHTLVTLNNARSAFAGGVTTLRSVADKNALVASIVYASENGILENPIPRIIPCGNGICMTGGHGSEFPNGGDIVDGPWEMRKQIRRNIQNGAQWIKLLTSKREFVPEFTLEELEAAVDECHRRNRKVAVHSGVPISIQMCIDAGVDDIEHGTFMSETQAAEMRSKGIAWVPTMMVYSEMAKEAETGRRPGGEYYTAARDFYRDQFKKLYDVGVLVGAGTDVPVDIHGVNTCKELEYMVEYGLTPLQAIQTATQNGARILGMEDRIGTIREGMEADLLLVKGDPSVDISAIENVDTVFQHGQIVFQATR